MSSTTSTERDLYSAFDETVQKLTQDMPLILHGSGDVVPSKVLPETAQYLAQLTTQYISDLADAALDAQRMLCDKSKHIVPPPSFPHSRAPPKPLPPYEMMSSSGKKRKATEEYWDQPLPEPKIRSRPKAPPEPAVFADEWVGVAGVDFFETSRRSAYVRGPDALTPQCFIFPVCHDVYAYGRVAEIQAAKVSTMQLLTDPTVNEMVRTEGQRVHHPAKPKDTTSDPEDEDEDEEQEEESDDEGGPQWPGLASILPVHLLNGDFGDDDD